MNRPSMARWRGWECRIAAACDKYRKERRAMIGQAHAKEGRRRGLVDFVGVLADGRGFFADAKTVDGSRWPLAGLADHQAKQLEASSQFGAVAGILLWCREGAFWLPWSRLGPRYWAWADGATGRGEASLDPTRAEDGWVAIDPDGDFLAAAAGL